MTNAMQIYEIGGILFGVSDPKAEELLDRLPGFGVFRQEAGAQAPSFVISRSSGPVSRSGELIYHVGDVECADIFFYRTSSGYLLSLGHQGEKTMDLEFREDSGQLGLWGDYAPDTLRFALWTAYGLAVLPKGRVAVHSSCIVADGRACLFLGESGTGKSTHTRLWRENIPGATLLNDDSPIVSAESDGVWVYGSPWSGKTPCFRRERWPLAACVRLSQGPCNRIRPLSGMRALAAIHPSCPPELASSPALYSALVPTLDSVLRSVKFFSMECLPDAEAASMSYAATLCENF